MLLYWPTSGLTSTKGTLVGWKVDEQNLVVVAIVSCHFAKTLPP